MILPSIMPDELARSYLGRICRLNGVMSPEPLRTQVERACASLVEKPEDCFWVELLAAMTQQTPQDFFARHTLLPFSRAVRPERECVNHGNRHDQHERIAHAQPSGSNESIKRLCPACVAEDIAFWGTSYWRRSHQLKAFARCEKHGNSLHQVEISKWICMPHDVIAHSVPIDAAIVEDAAQNPVITRYTEICSALSERTCPISTNQMVQTIRDQSDLIAKADSSWSRLGTFVFENIKGPWQRYFFEDMTVSPRSPTSESFGRTQSCVRLAYATHYYALTLAALFDSADEAILQISLPTLAAVRCKKRPPYRKEFALPLSEPMHDASLRAAVRAFLSGASIADVCRIHAREPHQIEDLLRVAAQPLIPMLV